VDFDGINGLRSEIDKSLASFFDRESTYLGRVGSELEPVADALGHFLLDSGKRLRPLFAAIGHIGAGGEITSESIAALSALELVHVCALIHDDVMDGSDTRRGAPSIHRQFQQLHKEQSLHGSGEQFGIASAILLGDLALIWAAKMLHESGLSPKYILQALPVYDEMRVELMAGQYLDIYEQAFASESIERSLKVARYKSGKYSIERPLHFGAALAPAAGPNIFSTYSHYGLPLGEAFQLRDDVIGVFGDPQETGKPAGDDLREGKRTVLIAATLNRVDQVQRNVFERYFGKSDLDITGVEALREIIVETGALAEVEKLIEEMTFNAHQALNSGEIEPRAKAMLDQMAVAATRRST
jgi:geranylgeranyl diphosphate synthase type I